MCILRCSWIAHFLNPGGFLKDLKARYLSVAETAKAMRLALKKHFPATKFSVRSHSYSGGASIDVGWQDGPTDRAVSLVVNQFESKTFDGSIDMATFKHHWLLPDGTIQLAYSPGTSGSGGCYLPVATDKPDPDAELVSFGSGYVFTRRTIGPAFARRILDQIAEFWGHAPWEIVEKAERAGNTYNGWELKDPAEWNKPVLDGAGRAGQTLQEMFNRCAADRMQFNQLKSLFDLGEFEKRQRLLDLEAEEPR